MRHRVAIVVPGLSDGGGVPAVAVFLREALQRSGRYAGDLISVAVSSKDTASMRLRSPRSWYRGPQEEVGTWEGIPFKHVGSHFAEIEVARYMPRRRLTKLLDEYDVVQIVAGSPTVACAVSTVCRPKCLSVATTILQDRKSALAKERGLTKLWRAGMTGVNLLLEGRVLARMDHVFAQSPYTRSLLAPFVPGGRLSMGPPGVNISLFRPGSDHDRGDDYILSVARFSDPRKNVEMLFRAYALVRRELRSPPRLVLAGTAWPTEGSWALARELGIGNRIEFRHALTIEELASVYRGATLFALPSNEEGFGMVLVEAMASGIPVVSTRCGGPESVIIDGETGYLTPVNDHRLMALKITELLADEGSRKQMGEAGRRLAEKRFSIEAAGSAYLQVYDRLLAANELSHASSTPAEA